MTLSLLIQCRCAQRSETFSGEERAKQRMKERGNEGRMEKDIFDKAECALTAYGLVRQPLNQSQDLPIPSIIAPIIQIATD